MSEIFVADFETTITAPPVRVWSAALCRFGTENVEIFGDIVSFWRRLIELSQEYEDIIIYMHNLKFDGTFILDYIYRNLKVNNLTNAGKSYRKQQMPCGSLQYLISDKGQWYNITYRTVRANYIEFRDSLKLLPFNLDKLCKDFDVTHKKTQMGYNKTSLAECSEQDIEYIKNDCLGLKECLEIFAYEYSLDKLTIGSTCYKEYKNIFYNEFDDGFTTFDSIFPNLEEIEMNPDIFDCSTVWDFVNKTYKGAWCYVNPKYQNKIININGKIFDVNSLYPFAMDVYPFPIRTPQIFEGCLEYNKIALYDEERYYFIKIRVNGVRLKQGHFPTIQIKNDLRFNANEWISNINLSEPISLYLTQTDYILLLNHYDIDFLEEWGGVIFRTEKGLFSPYIHKHMKVKETSTGAKKTIAKLFLNNLYGKYATSTKADYKIVEMIENALKYKTVKGNKKRGGFIAIGAAITAYARNYTITAAQANYNNFAYADTDSLHLVGDEVNNLKIHNTALGAWKCEGEFSQAVYLRQKTYVEKIDGEYKLTACGMNKKCKSIVIDLIKEKGIQVFNKGLIIEGGKLSPKLVQGGTLLVESTFTLK